MPEEVVDPERGFLVTANNQIVGDEFPHHITSDWLDGFRARRIEELLQGRDLHDVEGFEAMQSDNFSIPGLEAARRLGRLNPPGQRELSAIERLRSWDGNLDPDSVAGSIYQAFLLRLAREFCRAAIGDRDLSERWLDRADNGFLTYVTSAWRWHSHLMKLWEEGDEDLIGRPWDELVLEALSGALDDLSDRFGPIPRAGAGAGSTRWSSPCARRRQPGPAPAAQPQAAGRWGSGDGEPDRLRPQRPLPGRLGAELADADPTAPERSRWQMFTGQSGHPASPHYDDLQADWLEGRTQPMAGEGPWRELELAPASGT